MVGTTAILSAMALATSIYRTTDLRAAPLTRAVPPMEKGLAKAVPQFTTMGAALIATPLL